ncbi:MULTISPECIES: P-loop ATPase, Sll1717 family [unclassified Phenylobacterium]|uniref:P-loop ATPase, Sll1717 family n=1 Tax=unclassified Phenylobacterium TaxID=2640670 RepID=UPI0022B31200|nr:hypothetical protein [Phenylobacterium sp. NIBR 498073]WGU39640.1 hypothetical protein O4N75_18595 [Phenylobacterium sp. NIBR 498073]
MSSEFLRNFGFDEDPFASTNAADEPLIGQYFVEPPFFPAVVGDPRVPKSNVVFAPRGGGKTAQKIMIERKSADANENFLCISYDSFPVDNLPKDKLVPVEFHLNNICRTLLLAILLRIEDAKLPPGALDKTDKMLIVSMSRELLGPITSEKFRDSLNSIKSMGDKAADAWNRYGGVIVTLVNAISARFDFGKLEPAHSEFQPNSESIRFKFASLISLARKIGYSSTYILVDRVDEIVFTARDAERAFQFLESLLIDLPLLETPGVAFKFFLWDQMKEHYQSAGGRPDRLLEYTLNWSVEELARVLQRRLQSYSAGKVSRFDELLAEDTPYDVHKLVAYFAHGSPRDMVRICKKITDEHTRSGKFSAKIEFRTVKSAIMAFSTERARELYGEHFSEIRKVDGLNFTISALASSVFRVSQQAARAKVQKWLASGAVVKIGDVPNPGNRPQYLYGIVDPRLAVAVLSEASIEEAVEDFLKICPHCQSLRIAVEGDITCPDCQGNFKSDGATTLADVITRH